MAEQVCNTVMIPVEEYETLRKQVAELSKELETERMRLVACGCIAMANTPDSAAKTREMHPAYWSGSAQDVCRAVDQEMLLRDQLAAMTKERDHLTVTLSQYSDLHDKVVTLTAVLEERDDMIQSQAEGLAAAQARIVELREALDDLLETCELNGMHDDKTYQSSKRVHATPDDSSALDRRLQEERERCAVMCEDQDDEKHGGTFNDAKWHCAAAIRGMT